MARFFWLKINLPLVRTALWVMKLSQSHAVPVGLKCMPKLKECRCNAIMNVLFAGIKTTCGRCSAISQVYPWFIGPGMIEHIKLSKSQSKYSQQLKKRSFDSQSINIKTWLNSLYIEGINFQAWVEVCTFLDSVNQVETVN